MKILNITEFYPTDQKLSFTGGVESFNFYLAEYLKKKHQITVISRKRFPSEKKIDYQFGYKTLRVGSLAKKVDTSLSTIPARLNYFFTAILVALKEDFDLVQGSNFVTYLQAFIVGLIKRKPTIAWYPDVFIGRWIKLVGISGFFGEIVERLTISLPWKLYIAMSQETKKKLIKVGVPDGKVVVIGAGIDIDYYKKIKTKKYQQFTISCACRLVDYKRVDLLIRAIKILNNQKKFVKGNIYGDGPEKQNLLDLIKELNLTKQIKIISNASINSRSKEIKRSQLFCLPSEVEGFGIVLIEAAASGLPLLVTDMPIFKEVTKNGQGTLFFRMGDEKSLAKQILKLQDSNLRQKLAKQSLDLANYYQWPKIAKEFEKVYEDLLPN